MTLYQDDGGTHRVFVAVSKFTRALSPAEQQSFSVGMWRGIRDSAVGRVTLGPQVDGDAGRLGGTMTCAPFTAGATGRVCVSVDGTSFVMMMDFGSATDPTFPVTVRETVVHRT